MITQNFHRTNRRRLASRGPRILSKRRDHPGQTFLFPTAPGETEPPSRAPSPRNLQEPAHPPRLRVSEAIAPSSSGPAAILQALSLGLILLSFLLLGMLAS